MYMPESKAIETIKLNNGQSGAAWMDAIKEIASLDRGGVFIEKLYRSGRYVCKVTFDNGVSSLETMTFCPIGKNDERLHYFHPEHDYDRVEVISLADDEVWTTEDCAKVVIEFARSVENILKRGLTAPA